MIGQRLTMLRAHSAQWFALADYGVWSALWLAAHMVGGGLIGGALGALGGRLSAPHRAVGLAVLSILCLVWALRELGLVKVPMPQWPRQVQQIWLARLPWNLIAIGYGVQLGSAVATRIKTTTTYAALCCALLVGSAERGALVMAAFGLARAAPALGAGSFVTTPARSMRFAMQLDRFSGLVARISAAMLIGAAVALAWTVWGSALARSP